MSKGDPFRGWIAIVTLAFLLPVVMFAVLPTWQAVLIVFGLTLVAGLVGYWGFTKHKMDFFAIAGRGMDSFIMAFSGGSGQQDQSNKKVARPPTYWTNKLIEAVGGQCEIQSCRKVSSLQVHHIEEHAKGGSNRLNNLLAVCPNHHKSCETGGINKTRQRALTGRKNRFKHTDFPARWKKAVLDKGTREPREDEYGLGLRI